MADYTKRKRITESKKNCKCYETGEIINKFDIILFCPVGKKIFSKKSKTFKKFVENGK